MEYYKNIFFPDYLPFPYILPVFCVSIDLYRGILFIKFLSVIF